MKPLLWWVGLWSVVLLRGTVLCFDDAASSIGSDELPQPLPVSGKQIAIIFDDGPVAGLTGRLLDDLKKNGMKATFSLVGKNVQANPDLARRIVAEGHEVVNHTWSHGDLSGMTPDEITSELRKTEEIIYLTTGVRTRLFRPPFGRLSAAASAVIKSLGYEVLKPSLDTSDWRRPPPGAIKKTILDGVTPGAVILAHDSFPESVAEMPGIFAALSKRGFQSYTFSHLRSLALLQN